MPNQKLKHKLFSMTQKAIVPGANFGYAENQMSLSDHMETLAGSDGKAVTIKSVQIFIRARSTGVEPFVFLPVIVQTAGTFTDTVNLTERVISELLDQAMSDEFGYQEIGNPRFSKLLPYGGGAYRHGVETQFNIPKNIINLMNKQVSTERLQDLILGFVGHTASNTQFDVDGLVSFKYFIREKGITIR